MDANPVVIEFRGKTISVARVAHIGRHPACEISITDDALVSRCHATLTSDSNGTRIEDAGSANGVFVNGIRIEHPVVLKSGDVIRIGDQRLIALSPRESKRRSARTHPEIPAVRPPSSPPINGLGDGVTEPYGIDRYQLQWQQIEDAISRHDWALAGQLLRQQFARVTKTLEKSGKVSPATQESLCRHAIDMALASGDAVWLESLIEFHVLAQRPLPSAIAANLPLILARLRNFDMSVLQRYVDGLRDVWSNLSAVDRHFCTSIENALRVSSEAHDR